MLKENKNLAEAITDSKLNDKARKKLLSRLEAFGADNEFYRLLDDCLREEGSMQSGQFFADIAEYGRAAAKLEDWLDLQNDKLLAEVTPKAANKTLSDPERGAIWKEHHSLVRAVRLDYEERLRDAAAELIRSIPPLS